MSFGVKKVSNLFLILNVVLANSHFRLKAVNGFLSDPQKEHDIWITILFSGLIALELSLGKLLTIYKLYHLYFFISPFFLTETQSIWYLNWTIYYYIWY